MSPFYRCGKLMRPPLEGGIGSAAAGVEARGECHRSRWVLGFGSEPRGVSGVLGVASHPSFRRGFRRGKQAQLPPAQPPEGKKSGSTTGGAPGENTAGGSTVETGAEAETLRNQPFNLNQRQPVPPDFGVAYQRRALIVVEFFKEAQDTSRGIEYPQVIEPGRQVHQSLSALRDKYLQIEFFRYDIAEPGNAESSEELNQGEHGTLAIQL